MAGCFRENIWQMYWKQILWKCRIPLNMQRNWKRRTMNNKIDMTGKEQLQKLWKERKNMQQVIHSAVKNSKTGKLSYEMLFQELTLRYGSISGKNGENVILKGVLDNLLWHMIGDKELCEQITEHGIYIVVRNVIHK